jgi:hypothetical protein
MSKSKKKQRARERSKEELSGPDATLETVIPLATAPTVDDNLDDDFDDEEAGAPPALGLPERKDMPIDQVLFDRAVAAAINAGVMREEGDRLCYLFNGESIALKYTEPGEEDDQPARLLIAAFRQGVVFQVEGDRQVVYQPGNWEQELERLATLEPPDDEEDLHDEPPQPAT